MFDQLCGVQQSSLLCILFVIRYDIRSLLRRQTIQPGC